eukprot:TRINITY_DN918_c0_g1_i1.p1 TRINITY_DN918_c0_g1~~TRINITY_DN918_c0_g1_i1.p1  ORF type:complete len:146 (-),score=29.91 TRINITY_DN918_c0_g1_i1:153-590(-)
MFGSSGFESENSLWDNLFQDDHDEEKHDNEKQLNRDSIIFLIDCQKQMFVENDDNEIAFENALKCAISAFTDKIISNESDLLGICFYGTEKSDNFNDFKGVYVLQSLDIPDAQRILSLEEILEGFKENKTFEYGYYKEGKKILRF